MVVSVTTVVCGIAQHDIFLHDLRRRALALHVATPSSIELATSYATPDVQHG